MDELQYNEFGVARVSLELSREIIESIDKFKAEWGVTTRGAIVERLLQELLLSDGEFE
jgi:metal-responsive CopG/Arc/MetJ family transcriptional regulator